MSGEGVKHRGVGGNEEVKDIGQGRFRMTNVKCHGFLIALKETQPGQTFVEKLYLSGDTTRYSSS